MPQKRQKLFIIPEEPPVNQYGLAIPPSQTVVEDGLCTCCGSTTCIPDRHHVYWEKSQYTTSLYKNLRNTSLFIVKICRNAHDQLHNFQLPPRKPTRDIAHLALHQAELETKIATKYSSIGVKKSEQVSAKPRQLKRLELDVERLLDEIDELKEQKAMAFGNAGGVLPTQQYYIVRDGEVELTDTEQARA